MSVVGRLPSPTLWSGAALLLAVCAGALRSADDPVDFQRQIRPILADHCFECHGPDARARQADLRLDVRAAAVSEVGEGDTRAIVAGKPKESELLRRITTSDEGAVMPPPERKNPLTPEQAALLERWIAEGAPYSEHWAFGPPSRPVLPAADDATAHPIDAFVAARLARDGLERSPPARPEVLCRRIYLDVIGLPPSPDEVASFVAAAEGDLARAVSSLVDRLLASEHFGEKWARHWLDVARYADSHGYEKDLPR